MNSAEKKQRPELGMKLLRCSNVYSGNKSSFRWPHALPGTRSYTLTDSCVLWRLRWLIQLGCLFPKSIWVWTVFNTNALNTAYNFKKHISKCLFMNVLLAIFLAHSPTVSYTAAAILCQMGNWLIELQGIHPPFVYSNACARLCSLFTPKRTKFNLFI